MDLFKKIRELSKDKDPLLAEGEFVKLRKGQALWNRNDIAEVAAFVISGELNLTYRDEEKNLDIFLGDYFPGNMVGYFAARFGRKRMGDMIAVKNSEVFLIHHEKLTKHIESSKALASFMLSLTTRLIIHHEERIASLRVLDSKGRLASYLVALNAAEMDNNVCLPKIQNVASKLHMEKETLSRQLRLIEEEGYIKRNHKDVTILNLDGLKELAF